MSDLNKMMSEIQKESKEVEKRLKGLLVKYETLFKEGTRLFTHERIAVGSMEGLESFHRLVQTVRRNRDVVGSLIRGHNNLRSIADFSFVEEEVEAAKAPARKKSKSKSRPKSQPVFDPEPEYAASEEVDG